MVEMPHCGWPNYPTWAVNLWLGNTDAATYNATKATAKHGKEALQRFAEGFINLDGVEGMAADLLRWALEQVDWDYLIRAWAERGK